MFSRLGRSPDFLVYGHKQQWRAVAEAVRLSHSPSVSSARPADFAMVPPPPVAAAPPTATACPQHFGAVSSCVRPAAHSAEDGAAGRTGASKNEASFTATATAAVPRETGHSSLPNGGCSAAHNSSSGGNGGRGGSLAGDEDLKALTRRWHKAIQAAKSAGVSAAQLRARGDAGAADMLERYEEVLKACDAVDYADFILACTSLLKEQKEGERRR